MAKTTKPRKADFLRTPEGRQFLLDRYVNGNDSAYVLAAELGTYTNKLYRALKYHGFPRKTKGEAQKIALEKGIADHPTKGKELAESTKQKIGSKIHQYWQNLDEEARKQKIEKGKELWGKIDKKQRDEWRKKSHQALREAAQYGSKFEKALISALQVAGYKAQPHKKIVLDQSDMNVDIYLPFEGICVEVDGPTHFLPIFSDEQLEQTIERDMLKNQLLMGAGFRLIRISNIAGYSSQTVFRIFTEKFVEFLKEFIEGDEQYKEIVVEEFIKE